MRILASSDLHGRFTESPEGSMEGVVSKATAFKRAGEDVLLLDCGDMLTDSAEGWYFSLPQHKKAFEDVLSHSGYDALLPGNHDLQRLPLPQTGVPYTACNIVGCPSVRPYIMVERGGINVAIIGVVTNEKTTFPGGVRIMPPDKCIRQTVDCVLRLHKPDIIIAMLHTGRDETEAILNTIPEISLAIYGHDHIPDIFTTGTWTIAANPGKYGANFVNFTYKNGMIQCELAATDYPGDKIIPEDVRTGLDNTINAVLATIKPYDLSTLLHKAIRSVVSDAEVTAIPHLTQDPSLHELSVNELYKILPYDDYSGRWEITGRELRESGLDLMLHNGDTELIDERIYTVGVDCHTFPSALQASPLSLQSLLLENLIKQKS